MPVDDEHEDHGRCDVHHRPCSVNQSPGYEFGNADWESGAIAWTAARNGTRVLILRVVSDMVSPLGGEIYSNGDFSSRAAEVMRPLLRALPAWIGCAFPDKR